MIPQRQFDGATYDPARDGLRLNKQMLAVWGMISDGQWHTLGEIAAGAGCPESSASARLRDFRKEKNGSYIIERRHISNGLWEYRMNGRTSKDFVQLSLLP